MLSNMCICNIKLRKFEEALKFADETLKMDPYHVKGNYNKANILY